MPSIAKRWLFCLFGAVFILYNLQSWHGSFPTPSKAFTQHVSSSVSKWKAVQNTRFPLKDYVKLPTGPAVAIPKIQAAPAPETAAEKKERLARLQAVKDEMKHAWSGYKKYAWLKDEVTPMEGGYADKFGGWAATLVDSLDTLWIMGMKGEFHEAVSAVSQIDFSSSVQSSVNVFETTIRYLGGFLAAYDLSGEKVLLEKATELGEMLYVAFDTPNRMPVTRWMWKHGLEGKPQEAGSGAVIAEVASLCMEFTRLAQLTGDERFYDAIDRVTRHLADQQDRTYLPGLWPIQADCSKADFTSGIDFSIGAMADSAFEYLPKMHMLLGGRDPVYASMYKKAVAAMNKHVFYRALNEHDRDILFSADVRVVGRAERGAAAPQVSRRHDMQHLACYAGGMVALGARLFDDKANEEVARRLTDGCVWAYESAPHGIMPEIFTALPCDEADNPGCKWSEMAWLNASMARGSATDAERDGGLAGGRAFANRTHLSPGMVAAHDPRYLLRPEAIESVFYMHRVTAEPRWMRHGWNMFRAVINATRTPVAHAAVTSVMDPELVRYDYMESFWTAETLKYYYLLFSEPSVISLDEYALNTEAHPLRRPTS